MFQQMLGQLQQATYDHQHQQYKTVDNDQLCDNQFKQHFTQTVDTMMPLISGGINNGPQCLHCGKLYSNASNLRQHVRNVHAQVDRSMWHECNTCGKKLKTKHYLINHQLQAHGIHQRGWCNDDDNVEQTKFSHFFF